MSVYQGYFESWKDVVVNFGGPLGMKEPAKVYLAAYNCENYDGHAEVVWRQGHKYYFLEGSHCSCFGLEETGWDPEEFKTKKIFIEYLKKCKRNDILEMVK